VNTFDIDVELAQYSDWAFTTSVIVLVAALLLLAVALGLLPLLPLSVAAGSQAATAPRMSSAASVATLWFMVVPLSAGRVRG